MAITLVAPETDFTYRPMTVAQPLFLGHARQYALVGIAEEFGAGFIQDRVAEVRADEQAVRCASGRDVAFDHLVVAVGAKATGSLSHAITFGDDPSEERVRGMLADLEQGYLQRVAGCGRSVLSVPPMIFTRDHASSLLPPSPFALRRPRRRDDGAHLDVLECCAMADVGAWLLAVCGLAVVGIGVFFVAFRPPLLPEDRRYIAAPRDPLEAVLPGLGRWLEKVFWVMGGYMAATGVLTMYVALSGVRAGSATACVVASAAGLLSVGLMAVVNLMLRSDFRWPLLGLASLWTAAALLAAFGV